MNTDTAALRDLLERVEAGTLGSGDTLTAEECKLIYACFPAEIEGAGASESVSLAMDGSIDAAKALHEAVLPGYRWGRQWSEHMWVEIADIPGRSDRYYGENSDPARAWLIAIIRALHGDAQ